MRKFKGDNLISIESDYVCIDIETAGIGDQRYSITELSAVRVRDSKIADTFSMLVNPMCEISSKITKLTGITNDMVKDAPTIEKALPEYLSFIGDDIAVGHNISTFDVIVLYDLAEKQGLSKFMNDYIDTLILSKKLLTDLEGYSLENVSKTLSVDYSGAHRALEDCKITYQCYEKLKPLLEERPDLWTEKSDLDKSNPIYRRVCVVAGSVKGYTQSAIQNMITDLGGFCKKTIDEETDLLIVGDIKTEKAQQAVEKAKELNIKVIPAKNLEEITDFSNTLSNTFGCCHLFTECSDERKCLHRDQEYALGCAYRKNLEAGRIFYGVNCNV